MPKIFITITAYNPAIGIWLSLFVGYISSVLGVGGGFIHVPALTSLLNFPVHIATATSHFVLAIMALTGTLVHVAHGVFARGVAPHRHPCRRGNLRRPRRRPHVHPHGRQMDHSQSSDRPALRRHPFDRQRTLARHCNRHGLLVVQSQSDIAIASRIDFSLRSK